MKVRLIFWETTKACNLQCPHCRASATNTRSQGELSTDEAKEFIRDVASFSTPILVFSGGEPLLREDLYELIHYADSYGLKTAVATNATLITDEICARLKESRLSLVAVSIYGATAKTHDAFCSYVGAFDKIQKGIGAIKKTGLSLQINTTITKKNINELEAMGYFALAQGAKSFHPFFLVPTGRAKYFDDDEISAEEYEQVFNRLYNFQQNFPLEIKATCAPHYYRILNSRGGNGNGAKGCLAGLSVCFISYKGEVFGCGYLPVAAGDIRKQRFRNIWFESELFKILRDESKLQGKCGACKFKNVCGGCRARAYSDTGNYLEEEPKCVYQP